MAHISLTDRIYIAGHTGLVGSAILRGLKSRGYKNLIVRTREELDLSNAKDVQAFFKEQSPEVVFIAAAKVGGIYANNTYRADFLIQNLNIQNNIIWNALTYECKRLVFLGSSCIYPKLAQQPIAESQLLTSNLEYTNRPYAIAKIAGLELVDSIRKQYNKEFFSIMPTNLYGPGDNYHPKNSHVVPALLRKFHEGTVTKQDVVEVWGTGKVRREFLYSDDCASGIIFLAEQLNVQTFFSEMNNNDFSHINLGTGEDITIKELADLCKATTGFQGEIVYNTTYPDGPPRKLLDIGHIKSIGWESRISLDDGLKLSYDDFLSKSKDGNVRA